MNKSYAKINLILEVLGQRKDGYHNLCSIVAKIDYYDEINIKINNLPKHHINLLGPISMPIDESNLMIKSLNLLKEYFNIKDFFTITITKNIPLNSGLGGGSSNAALVTRWFLKHYQLQMDPTLYNLLLDISSDMGIFLTQGNLLLVEGRGEKITPLKIDVNYPITLLLFDLKLSSKRQYHLLSTHKDTIFKNLSCHQFIKSPHPQFFNNDFKKVLPKNLVISKITNLFVNQLQHPLFLSGKGPTHFITTHLSPKEKNILQKYPVVLQECKTLKNNV